MRYQKFQCWVNRKRKRQRRRKRSTKRRKICGETIVCNHVLRDVEIRLEVEEFPTLERKRCIPEDHRIVGDLVIPFINFSPE